MENGEELFYLKDSGATVCSLRVKKLLISNTISTVSINHFSFQALNITIRTDKKVKKNVFIFLDSKEKKYFCDIKSNRKKHEYEKNIFYVSCPLVVCNGTSTGQC